MGIKKRVGARRDPDAESPASKETRNTCSRVLWDWYVVDLVLQARCLVMISAAKSRPRSPSLSLSACSVGNSLQSEFMARAICIRQFIKPPTLRKGAKWMQRFLFSYIPKLLKIGNFPDRRQPGTRKEIKSKLNSNKASEPLKYILQTLKNQYAGKSGLITRNISRGLSLVWLLKKPPYRDSGHES